MVTWLSILRTLLKPFYLIGVLGALLLMGIGAHDGASDEASMWIVGAFTFCMGVSVLVRVIRHAKLTLLEKANAPGDH